mgnify:CR=1 FL=1
MVSNLLTPFFSLTGEKLTELTDGRLPVHCADISVRGDELAVAAWKDCNLVLFRLQFGDEQKAHYYHVLEH